MRTLAVLLLLVAAHASARAEMIPIPDDPPATPPETKPPPASEDEDRPTAAHHWMLEGGFGVRVGTARLNSHSAGAVIPGHADIGVRHGRIVLYGEYQLSGISYPGGTSATGSPLRIQTGGSADGLQHRLGALGRYTIGRDDQDDTWMDLWVEGGFGVEQIRWDAGGTWTRPDVALGVGVSLLGWGHTQHGGLSLALRIVLAPRSDVANAPAACGGPCDVATPPAGFDRSFLFDATMMFGR